MAVPPLIAAKAAQSAAGGLQKALTGDIYIRKWQSVKKRPKSKGGPQIVDHEAHINPVMAILGLGAAATAAVAAMWIGQRKLSYGVPEGGAKLRYLVKQYDAIGHYETVIDTPAVPEWDEEVRNYFLVENAKPIVDVPALPPLPWTPTGQELAETEIPFGERRNI